VHVVTLTALLCVFVSPSTARRCSSSPFVIALGFSPRIEFHVESDVGAHDVRGSVPRHRGDDDRRARGGCTASSCGRSAEHRASVWAVSGWVLPYAYAVSPGVPFTLRQMADLSPWRRSSGSPAPPLAVLWLVPAAFTPRRSAFVTTVSGSIGDIWIDRPDVALPSLP
jgi:hypothetical protein